MKLSFNKSLIIFLGIFSVLLFVSQKNRNTSKLENISGTNSESKVDVAKERERWRSRIETIGAQAAYGEFKKEYQDSNLNTQHTAAHLIGEVLYEKVGIRGLAICDATFSFGCYHSFFGDALTEKGIGVVSELDKVCVDSFGELGTGCQHGIGHGLVEYLGRKDLLAALDGCLSTTQRNPLFGCTDGVFMEYNIGINFGLGKAETAVREFTPENPYEPCNTIVPGRFRTSCYFEIAHWWKQVLNADYKRIGVLCSGIERNNESEACFVGIGSVIAATTSFDVEATIADCERMPKGEGILLCKSGASWAFFAVPEKRHLNALLCEGYQEKERDYCYQKSDLIGNGEIFQSRKN